MPGVQEARHHETGLAHFTRSVSRDIRLPGPVMSPAPKKLSETLVKPEHTFNNIL